MANLSALGIRRLRSLYDLTPPIELKPITILLGKNSAGKSSFARLFPLLRQSVERKKRAPILWFGDLVDFGSLKQAITRGHTEIELIFSLNLTDAENNAKQRRRENSLRYYAGRRIQNDILIEKATVSLTLKNDPETDSAFASKLKIDIEETSVELNINPADQIATITIDGNLYSKESIANFTLQGQLLPSLVFLQKDPDDEKKWKGIRNPFQDRLLSIIRGQVHGNTSEEVIADIASQLVVTSRKNLANQIKSTSGPPTWEATKKSCNENSRLIQRLVPALIAANITSIIDYLDESLAQIFSGVRYLKPLRATAERYYRRLDLAISEIDPEGRNFPMFLDSLSNRELASFRAWTRDNLSIDVEPHREGAQLMVMAKSTADTEASNIADMGFGISQILPIAAQLWSISQTSNRSGTASFIAIEQPELHLHPEYQARLGDVFAGFIRAAKSRQSSSSQIDSNVTKLVIETHSQQLVNRLGALIEEGTINPEEVSIVLFEPDKDRPGTTKCRISNFDNSGVLTNWPYGFFEPSV